MYGDVVTTGQCCGINGCQRVVIEYMAGGRMAFDKEMLNPDVDVTTALQNPDVTAKVELQNPNVVAGVTLKNDKAVNIGVSLVCKTSVGNWEYLLVEEGRLLLIDGQAVMVRRKK
jgi:hypothetical protein